MRKFMLAGAALAILAGPAAAALPIGAEAPLFEAEAAENGAVKPFSLAEALEAGPVVLYFYPKANTKTCDMQAAEFARQTDAFAAFGARVVGVSADAIDTLKAYSADPEKCAGKFAVVSDAKGEVMKAYDAVASANPANAAFAARVEGLADRTTYVITPDGAVLFVHHDMREPLGHVNGALDALADWAERTSE